MPNTIQKPRFDTVQQEAYLSLWRTYDRLKLLEDQMFSEYELSAQQYNTLRLLRAVHPKTLKTNVIGKKLISRAPDMTRLLDRLEARKLIDRERPSDNRRTVEVGISQAGIELLEQLESTVRECHQRQFGHLSESDLKRLIELLHLARFPHEEEDSIWRHEV